jgi:hypothetical protein
VYAKPVNADEPLISFYQTGCFTADFLFFAINWAREALGLEKHPEPKHWSKKAKEREDCVLRDLLGAARIRTVTLMAALLITLLAALGLTMYYADAIDNWRP